MAFYKLHQYAWKYDRVLKKLKRFDTKMNGQLHVRKIVDCILAKALFKPNRQLKRPKYPIAANMDPSCLTLSLTRILS